MRVFGPGSVEKHPDAEGVFSLLDVETYVVDSEEPLPLFSDITRLIPGSRLIELKLLNYLGDGVIGPLRFRVASPKLSELELQELIDDVVREACGLPFGVDAPAGAGFELASNAPDVPFHLLAWLRHVMRDGTDSLPAQFLQIARQPHRKVESEAYWEASWLAPDVSASTLISLVTQPERLLPIAPGHSLHEVATTKALKGRFPRDVVQHRRFEDFDTHENRLVKATLQRGLEIVSSFIGYEFRNPLLRLELKTITESLEWMLSHDFLADVGGLAQLPLQSTVLHRRAGYRDFLGHYLSLTSGSGALDKETARALLDLKKVSLLYELWCFFTVRRCLVEMLGAPELVSVVRVNDTSVALEAESEARWSSTESFGGDVRLTYNPAYRRPESYSLEMKPDIVVEVGDRRLVLDAKFRFERTTSVGASEAELSAKRDDFLKMHAYRDSIRGVIGAYALFPGTEADLYSCEGGWGVGAVPLRPGHGDSELRWLLAFFLANPGRRGADRSA